MIASEHHSRPISEQKTERQKRFELQHRIFEDFQTKIAKLTDNELMAYAKMNNIETE